MPAARYAGTYLNKEIKTAKAPDGTDGSFGLWQFYYSTVTDFAKFLGLSTSRPLPREM